jgi:hypothetical protein
VRLDISNGCQDHTTSPSASVPFVLRVPDAHRSRRSALHHVHARDTVASTASHPNVRDDREPPLFSGWDARAYKSDLPDGLSEIFFPRPLDRNSRTLPVGQITEVSCIALTRYSTLMSRRFSYCAFADRLAHPARDCGGGLHNFILPRFGEVRAHVYREAPIDALDINQIFQYSLNYGKNGRYGRAGRARSG